MNGSARKRGRVGDPDLSEAAVTGGRIARRRKATRASLLRAAYEVMAEVGIDAAKIKDITDLADIGFGTFYNYFENKDDLAGQVLDCIVHDCGLRNAAATRQFSLTDPAAVMALSIRMVVREAATDPIWRWWARRPDLLVDRIRDGFAEFAKKDMMQGIEQGFARLAEEDVDQAWALACWVIVGGIHDIVVGNRPADSAAYVGRAIARAWGYDLATAERVARIPLPEFGPARIDWDFVPTKGETA